MPHGILLSRLSHSNNTHAMAQEKARNIKLNDLTALALSGLGKMFDSEKQLFCFRLKPSQGRLAREAVSARYTIISLIGLHRLEQAGSKSAIQARLVFDSLMRNSSCADNFGDLGLILWLCSLARPEQLEEVYFTSNVRDALTDLRAARERKTMELAWFLSGLAHAASVKGQRTPGLGDLAVKTYELLKENRGTSGTFGHLATEGTLAGVLRGHIGSFADQVYPIYALARFAEVFHVPAALGLARRCAEAICRTQGPLGQWWWHYDARTAEVLQYYPVYSVHQHGMAPMALFALSEAAQVDFSEPAYKGLNWIARNNELDMDLRDGSAGVVWRSIGYRKSFGKYLEKVLSFARFSAGRRTDGFEINYECRPYELGWLAYAFAGRCT